MRQLVHGARLCVSDDNDRNVTLWLLLNDDDVGDNRFRCAAVSVFDFELSF